MRASLFSTRLLRKLSNNRNKILDAGCGSGVQALYLAKINPASSVCGYDISPEEIQKANEYKQNHGIQNATFFVSSHDDFASAHRMDMIYTTRSLVGNDEIPSRCKSPLLYAEGIVKRRLSRFREMLTPHGIYILEWGADKGHNEAFVMMAESCDMKHIDTVVGNLEIYDYGTGSRTCLVFERIQNNI